MSDGLKDLKVDAKTMSGFAQLLLRMSWCEQHLVHLQRKFHLEIKEITCGGAPPRCSTSCRRVVS